MSAYNGPSKFHVCGHHGCAPCTMTDYEAADIDYTCEYLDRVVEAGLLNGACVDVGAHVGLWSLSWSDWYTTRYNIVPLIYALEPAALNYRALLKNAQQGNTGIVPVQVAGWNKNEWLFLQHNVHPGRHRVSNIGRSGHESLRVQGVALDTVSDNAQNRQVDCMKVDVEGAELLVMNGARNMLLENKQLLVVLEYSVDHFMAYGYRAAQLTAFMKAHGFRPARPVDEAVVARLDAGAIKRVMFVKGEIS